MLFVPRKGVHINYLCMKKIMIMILTLLIFQTHVVDPVNGFQYDRENERDWESVESFRKRHGMEPLEYNTTSLHPQVCRHLNRTFCQSLDTRMRKLQAGKDATGDQKLLVVLMRITNFETLPKSQIETLFNGRVRDPDITPTGSVYEYFERNSMGQLLTDAYVLDWIPAGKSELECAGSNGQRGVWDGFDDCFFPALDELERKHLSSNDPFRWQDYDKDGNGVIDNLIILHNGYASEAGNNDPAGTPPENRIRSHAKSTPRVTWRSSSTRIQPGIYAVASAFRGISGGNLMRINVVMHEYIHTFGMIDLYDIDFVGYGCGGYDLMAYPRGQRNLPIYPSIVGPYTKIFLRWLTPTEITQDGTYPVNPSLTTDQVYIIRYGLAPNEYFLVENRQPIEWDDGFWGGGGIVIWYVDDDVPRNDCCQTKVAIIQADGRDDLENKVNFGDADDTWKAGGSKSELSDSGYPNTRSRRTGQSTGLRLYDFSSSQTTMSFKISGFGDTSTEPTETPIITNTPTDSSSQTPTTLAPVPASSVPTPAVAATMSPTQTKQSDPPSGVPTNTLTISPTPTSDEDGVCWVSVNEEQCGALLQTVQIVDVECDCFYFCDGQLLGCCPYDEGCVPLDCPSGNFVAGCQLMNPSNAPSTVPSEIPSGLPSEFPSSNPTLQPSGAPSTGPTEGPSQSPSSFPSSDPSSMPTLMPTHFPSPFPTSDPTMTPTTNEPTAVPTEEKDCFVNVATDQCQNLMSNNVVDLRPDEGCDCYNFCNGIEINCCAFDEACPFDCTGDFVAGCTEASAVPAPTPSPNDDDEGMCWVSVNPGRCTELLATQIPLQDCDCYNYCNDVFIGCCGYDDICRLECNGELVAGCRWEATCLVSERVDECLPLMEIQDPIDGCTCYNFCDGQLVGCCEYDQICSHECPEGHYQVAGCTFPDNDNSPTSTPTINDDNGSNWPTFFWPDGFSAPRFSRDGTNTNDNEL